MACVGGCMEVGGGLVFPVEGGGGGGGGDWLVKGVNDK